MKKIALLIPNLAGGGAERVVSRLSKILNKEFEVYLALLSAKKVEYGYDGRLIDFDEGAARGFFGKFTKVFRRSFKIRRFKKEYKIDTTVSFLATANILNVLNPKNDKIIVSVRNYVTNEKGFYRSIHKWLTKILYNKADLIVSVSQVLKNDLIYNYKIMPEKVKVIYNPYDIDSIKKLANEKLDEDALNIFKKDVIISVGRLEEQKGHDSLIRAFCELRRRGADVELVILGDDLGLGEYLCSLSKDSGMSEHIHFMGFRKNPYKFIANSKFYVLSSHFEGFPNALAEAMVCGKAVIATDCLSGPREILAPNTDLATIANDVELAEYGVLIPRGSVMKKTAFEPLSFAELKMAEAMEMILNDDKLRRNYESAGEIRTKDFTFEKVLAEWKNIL